MANYTPQQMVDAINAVAARPEITVTPFTATANGTYTPPSGSAYGPVTVSIPVYAGEVQGG